MAENDAESDALERLEAALGRIAARTQAPSVDASAVAARLDRLIGQLQDALADDAEAGA